ncbi:PH domain-containing protein [Psychromonas sp. B3M02]|uniref:PH domain-containing protein n=1 Tax=Psychromonas sp. B3M02 TaxID=2267226 RepID=UPI000DEA8DFC|nr:PH domain-containing protein [Psychromonas sp. B3M02]RBW47290.1 PH domain-containing protein [Psychromonas sp. B3M02]
MLNSEEKVWADSPSQIINLGSFIFLFLFFWLVIPLFIIVWKYLSIKCTRYELTNERLKVKSGILNKKIDELELYRVKDYRLEKPFFLRLFSKGNIILDTSDKTHPTLILRAISNSEELCDILRTNVEYSRKKTGVREVSVD